LTRRYHYGIILVMTQVSSILGTDRDPAGKADDADLFVVDRVERELRSRLEGADKKLPHERDLAIEYGVSRRSVRDAIARLKKDRLLRSIPGKGTFILSETKKATTIHVMACSTVGLYNLTFLSVLSDLIRKRGFTSHIVTCASPVEEWKKISSSPAGSVGGILVGPFRRQEIAAMVENSDLPLVHVSEMDEEYRTPPVCDTVLNDNTALAFRATEYLLRQGHRRIALIGWGNPRIWDRECVRGYTEAFRLHGMEPDSDWHLRLPIQDRPDLYEASHTQVCRQIEGWFKREIAPTALIHPGEDELQMRDSIQEYFGDLFAPDAVISMTFWEMLLAAYKGRSDVVGFCPRLRDLGGRALDLLVRPKNKKEPACREFHGKVFMVRRENGIWRETNE
jgi:hypothetical protein